MGFDEVMGASMRMLAQMEALAALGARLTLAADGAGGDAAVTPLLDRVVELLGVSLDGLTPAQQRQVASTMRTFFLQAAELMAAPGRAPAWVFEDPALLQAQGAASGAWPALVSQVPELAEALGRASRFLDVGTGVGLLAVSACRTWPALRVVGIDPWAPSLALARGNVRDAGLEDRIELRQIGVEALAEDRAFDVAWLPAPFLPPPLLDAACARVRTALVPGGRVVLGLYAAPADPLAQTLSSLRVVRSGGALLDPPAAVDLLTRAGFADVRAVTRTWQAPMDFVIASA